MIGVIMDIELLDASGETVKKALDRGAVLCAPLVVVITI
jgi:hypothetical protein